MTLNFTRILLIAIALSSAAGYAARPLGPPIAELFKNDNRIARGVLVDRPAAQKITLRVDDYVYRSDVKTLTLNVDKEVFASVTEGREYLVVFSRLQRNRLLRDQWEINPQGPALVSVRGLGTPAIYASTEAIRTLLRPPEQRPELSADAATGLLITLAENSADGRARELGIFELYLRDDLQATISAANARRFAVLAAAAGPRLKNFLLQAATHFPKQRREPWLSSAFRQSVADYGSVLELNSYVPLLVKNALLGLGGAATADDAQMITKHLYSNAPGVARAALAALDAIAPHGALEAAKQALENQRIAPVTRRLLRRYISQHGSE